MGKTNVFFFILSIFLASSCGGIRPVQFQSPATGVPLAPRNYTMYKHGLKGEACNVYVFGFGIGDESYNDAIARIHDQVAVKHKEYQLVNIVEDSTFEFYLFSWKSCTVITADVVILEQPAYFDSKCAVSAKKQEKASKPRPLLPQKLSKIQVKTGMDLVSLKIEACVEQYLPYAKKNSVMNTQITIARTGRVVDVNVMGPFSNAAATECIADAIKTATFPEFKDPVMNVDYPIVLKK